MAEIKQWSFPTFEEWEARNCKWCSSIGNYNCVIEPFMFGTTNTTFICAVSVDENPANIYSKQDIRRSKSIGDGDSDGLKLWYNNTIKFVKDEWQEYMSKTYINDYLVVSMSKGSNLVKEIRVLNDELSTKRSVLFEKTKELQKVCKHKDVEYENYCTDDWAIPHWWQDSYKCKICGLSACSPEYTSESEQQEVSDDFAKLYKAYWKYNQPSSYRVENFDKHYIIKNATKV